MTVGPHEVGAISVGLHANTTHLDTEIQKGMTAAATKGATAAKRVTANTGRDMSAAISSQIAKGSIDETLKRVTESGSKAAEARAKLAGMRMSQNAAAELRHARVADAINAGAQQGSDRAANTISHGRIRTAIGNAFKQGGADGEKATDAAAHRAEGKVDSAVKHGSAGFKSLVGVIAQNSDGALGPIQEIFDKVEGLGAAFEGQGRSIGKTMVGIGAAITGAGAVLGTIVSKDQVAQGGLRSTIENTGKSWDDYKDRVEEVVKSGLNLGFSSNSSMDALSRLTLSTKDAGASISLLPRAMDLARRGGMSLTAAATTIAVAVGGGNGASRTLRRYGIDINTGAKATKDLTAAQQAHKKAIDDVKKAQQALADTNAKVTDSNKRHKASADEVLRSQLGLQSAEAALAKLRAKGHGPVTPWVDTGAAGRARSAASAQASLNRATVMYGAGSAAAAAAQARLSAAQSGPHRQPRKAPAVATADELLRAQERVTLAQHKLNDVTGQGAGPAKNSVTQIIELRKAHERLAKAQQDAAQSSRDIRVDTATVKKIKPIAQQIDEQLKKSQGGAAENYVKSWTGQLRVLGVKIDAEVAHVGAPIFKDLVMVGPALMGVGAVIESGIVGKMGKAVGATGKFGAAVAKIPFKGLAPMSKFLDQFPKLDGIRLRFMNMTSAMGTGWGKFTSAIGDASAWVKSQALMVAHAVKTGIVTAAAWAGNAAETAWNATKRFFITTTNEQTGATQLSTVRTWANTAATKVAEFAQIAWGKAVKAFTAVQWALNAAMEANPIGMIVLALAAVGVAVYLAWTHFKTFRDVVKGAWAGIQVATQWAWGHVLKPTFEAIGKAANFLWRNVIRPWATGIGASFKAVGQFGQTLWDVLRAAFKAVVDGFLTVAGSIVHTAAHAFGWIPGLGGKIKSAAGAFDSFRDQVNAALGGITDKTVTVSAQTIVTSAANQTGNAPGSATYNSQVPQFTTVTPPVRTHAAGGIEHHVAQVAPGRGPVRVWGEPETGGEAYIPLAPGKRGRSKALLHQVAKHFGMGLFADGGMSFGASVPSATNMRGHAATTLAAALLLKHLMPGGTGGGVLPAQTSAASLGVLPASAGSGGPGAKSAVVAMARKMAQAFAGWGIGSEWAAMYRQIQYESGWSNTAQNPTSTAYGLGQFLNSTWRDVGISKTSDPATQILGYLRYVKGRYGDPIKSWAFETRNNYYGNGGITGLAGGGMLPSGPTIAINLANGRVTRLNERGNEAVVPAHMMGWPSKPGHQAPKPKPAPRGFNDAKYLSGTDIRNAALGAPPLSQLQGNVTHTAAAVVPLQRQYNAIKKVDDADHKHVTTIADHIKSLREQAKAFGTMSAAQQAAYAAAHKGQPGIQQQIAALVKQEDAAKKAASAQDKLLTPAAKRLTTAQQAAKDAAAALHDALVAQATDMSNAIRTSATQGTDVGSLFNYNPGYGANSAAQAEAILRNRIGQFHTFSGLLHRLAQKGLDKQMLQDLISAGPQAGIAIATNILNDPNAITTLNSLEADLQQAITSTSEDIVSTTLGVPNPGAPAKGKPKPKPKPKAPPPKKNPGKPKPPPGKHPTEAHYATDAGVDGFSPVPAMVVQGDFVVNSTSDITRLSQLLHTQKIKTTRAKGGTRR